ncbi:MAG: sigma-70 family RNA polymerase sigma factor [Chloroflexota bacterium]
MSVHALSIQAGGSIAYAPAGGESPEKTLCALMSEHERSLYLFLLVRLGNSEQALDSVQETFLRAFQALRRGRQINRQWLFTVARNHAVDSWRRCKKVDAGPGALEQIGVEDTTDQRMIVRQIMDQLPRLDRDVLYLHTVCGFTTHEIGGIVGASGAAVRQRLYRARERFRLLYEDRS